MARPLRIAYPDAFYHITSRGNDTRKTLKEIGSHFGIGQSGVSQASRRIGIKISQDNKLRKKDQKNRKEAEIVKNEDLTPINPSVYNDMGKIGFFDQID